MTNAYEGHAFTHKHRCIHRQIYAYVHRQADSVSYPIRQWTNMIHRSELPNTYMYSPRHYYISIVTHTHTKMYSYTQTARCAHAYNLDGVLIHGILTHTDIHTSGHVHLYACLHELRPVHHSSMHLKSDMKTQITYKTRSLTIMHTMYVRWHMFIHPHETLSKQKDSCTCGRIVTYSHKLVHLHKKNC